MKKKNFRNSQCGWVCVCVGCVCVLSLGKLHFLNEFPFDHKSVTLSLIVSAYIEEIIVPRGANTNCCPKFAEV